MSRIRKLTFKAMELYEKNFHKHSQKFSEAWSSVESFQTDYSKTPVQELASIESKLSKSFDNYEASYLSFYNFLYETRTESSLRELKGLETLHDQHLQLYTVIRDEIIKHKQKSAATFSVSSPAPSLKAESQSSQLAQKYAEAEAAKAKVRFAEEEAILLRQKSELKEKETVLKAASERKLSDIETSLTLLSHKKAAAAATAEVEALESLSCSGSIKSLEIKKQTEIEHSTSDITNFLLKKELLFTRLTKFNDSADSYQPWKSSFQLVCKDLQITVAEEIDLLIKWLGSESQKHAQRLKNVYRNDPNEGLSCIWKRLDERYGSIELVYKSLMNKLNQISKLTYADTSKWYDLVDTMTEIQALKEDPQYSGALSYFDSSLGTAQILMKLPLAVQEKWAFKANSYKKARKVSFIPFTELVLFISEQASVRNDPTLAVNNNLWKKPKVTTNKSDITTAPKEKWCPLHKKKHSLNECRSFKEKSFQERKQFLKVNRICFKCCDTDQHKASECQVVVKCSDCGKNHASAMHISRATSSFHGGETSVTEPSQDTSTQERVNNNCQQICGKNSNGKSCAKIFLVNIYHSVNPSNVVKCYCIVDEQSNKSLIKPQLFTLLGIDGQKYYYTLNSCSGTRTVKGRKATGCILKSLDGSVVYMLPSLIECDNIPNNRDEICTPKDASYHSHLSHLAPFIPDIDAKSDILMIIGRDVAEAHHVREQITGKPGSPFAQKLDLGWAIIGEVCLGKVHMTERVNVNKTNILSTGQPTLFSPCDSKMNVKEIAYGKIFINDTDDDKPGLSYEDKEFLSLMDETMKKAPSGRWTAPLPFKSNRPSLPNNRNEALRRAKLLSCNLEKNPVKKSHMFEFMEKIFMDGNAEVAPDLAADEESWFLPIFGIYHPKKPGKIRAVFDSSASFQGISLNTVLMTGPDLVNNLSGVLMRFRRERVAMACDIEQMFYSFEVDENHRNYLRFFWYEDNDFNKPLIEYRMCRHVFGNSPSPAIATYGLRKSVENSELDVQNFVYHNFYVDDGLISQPSSEEVVDLMTRTQADLAQSKLRLHKIISNSADVTQSFVVNDLAKDLRSLSLGENLPVQRSLGLVWDLNSDSFAFNIEPQDKHPTRRIILSRVNSVFDPLGFLAPFTLIGKLILRDIILEKCDWDDPVSSKIEARWLRWEQQLPGLGSVKIPRCYLATGLSKFSHLELHVFSDASELAISAVAYLVGCVDNLRSQGGFAMGKSRVAPTKGHTVPRLELCAAVLAVEIAQTISEQLGLDLSLVRYYTDSRICLGYIHNQTRRFYKYVSNRIQKIRHVSEPKQWSFVRSNSNPADTGTRGVGPGELQASKWLSGPEFLCKQLCPFPEFFPVIEPENDKEIKFSVSVNRTSVKMHEQLCVEKFERFSSWPKLITAFSNLRHIAKTFSGQSKCHGWHFCSLSREPAFRKQTENLVLRMVQADVFSREIDCLKIQKSIDRDSPILALDPFLDENGLLRVGGRLRRSCLFFEQKHPIILSGKQYLAKLLVNFFHISVQHQGRLLTEGAVREAGYWITGGKRLISSQIYQCVTCKKVRGRFHQQKMSDLPEDRVKQAPPFSYVGVDVFGPWSVVARRTRGGQALSKRWAVLFSCLTIRAVHVEIIDEMSSSAFINALRRFMSIRGKVKQFRSDRGTNFIGATDHLKLNVVNVEDEASQSFFQKHGCTWVFNAPHSSHMAGSWERMIGIIRRILEAMLLSVKTLTHDMIVTLMAEVCAIVNSRPIVSVSDDPDNPEILTPSMLLTSKAQCDDYHKGDLDLQTMYREQWKLVQCLAERFWVRWRREYLNTLQKRQKWTSEQSPLEVGDIVLVKDSECNRNYWPLGRVRNVYPSADNRIRKVEVSVWKNNKLITYTRPIVELVLLVKVNK